MKVDERTRFPHPVLSEDTGDYLSGEFRLEVTDVTENVSDQVILDYTASLTEEGLLGRVADGSAAVGIFVTCLDTYFNRVVPLGLSGGRFSFDPGVLVGRVEIRPLIWARTPIPALTIENCHPEFGEGAISLDTGAVLAFGDLQVLNIGREKLAQMDTIFSIVRDDRLPPDRLSVNLDAERIQVLVAANVHQDLNVLREKAFGPPIVLNGVFLPAVMQVLDTLRWGTSEYEGRRWHRVFTAKCDHLGIDTTNPDLWTDAQRLLLDPFSAVRKERMFFEG
ncbi:hypothetical protein CU102_12590 [Phyllobacterium brassicacearum]|uniref:Uncharacterized protein n=1 Tax=Phyllobacterium brassicacearum TaxID=314235 RepID=A0A2P7BQ85_9HYPH|nr:hypothetical protein [Phyllobacterium brassicacearum]PSH68595.1 hypothetical protein CU102_12590 [Phyllobacterium brassicacearum]TDQ24144.1 hypothetical protein DEV91_11522 [Phyllobacterium brassicacearum]